MVRMLGGRARPLADDMEGRAATDLAKQRLKMTTFLGLLERSRESLWLLKHLFPYARTSSNTVRRDAGDGSTRSCTSSFPRSMSSQYSQHAAAEERAGVCLAGCLARRGASRAPSAAAATSSAKYTVGAEFPCYELPVLILDIARVLTYLLYPPQSRRGGARACRELASCCC